MTKRQLEPELEQFEANTIEIEFQQFGENVGI